MNLITTEIYYIFQVNGKEFHYPKAVWSEESARKNLDSFIVEIGKFDAKRAKKVVTDSLY